MNNGVNKKEIGDIAIDEINYYLKKYEKNRDRFHLNHKITRRLTVLSVFWTVLSLAILLSNTVFKVDLVKLNPYQFVGFDVVNWHVIIFWPTVVVFLFIKDFSNFFKAIWLLEFGVFLAFYSSETIAFYAVFHISLFVTCYALNRMNGYTRGWSRNRLAAEHLELLKREYRIAIRGQEEEFIRIEQENTLAKLSDIYIKNREVTHADIVGDYIAVNNGALSWIKGLKK